MPEADRVNTAGIHKRFEPQPHGIVPTLMPGQGVAHSVFAYLEWVLNVVQTIAGQHEGGLAGGVPANVEAGVALEAIAERDTSRLAGTAMEIGRAIRSWAHLTLQLWKQFKSDEETVSVTGRFMETEVFSFSGTQVLDSMDVTVVPESVMPSSRAAKFQKAMTLFTLRDEMGRPAISLRELKRRVGEDTPEFMSREQLELANARQENAEYIKTRSSATLDHHMLIEDHLIHIEEHKLALVSPEFRQDPQAWDALAAHLAKHQLLAQQQMLMGGIPGLVPGLGPGMAGGGGPMPAGPGDPSLDVQTDAAAADQAAQ
jgi:hypothetical protein